MRIEKPKGNLSFSLRAVLQIIEFLWKGISLFESEFLIIILQGTFISGVCEYAESV